MTHKEFIEVQAKHGTEFKIMFHRDDNPSFLTVKALKVDEEGCTLHFVVSPNGVMEAVIGMVLGDVIEYTWDELKEGNVDLMEIWV